MKLRTKYDEEADAAYIYLDDKAKVARTVVLNSEVNLDLDNEGRIVGIELMNAKAKLSIPELKQAG